ncbi:MULTISPECIES: TIGR02569 family protein [Amycolatopsis]|uniref:TIGR02569 family protein n=1 Tax=Amycolatopsis dendrobii TaxID=2760662 RepID=A0A7W3Z8Y8_9PSEU|nr:MULTISPECIES: TIGR02569 family protein [Amycolatopsis]MBB1152685.1 TIGR02569 family protein [Amycolatopsis dendrobii]UKD52137.1 TIGR02569 family protein [Amycolatopsis sp. FU40]
MNKQPPADVLAAFGCAGVPVRLEGGKGETWRAGDIVLKPVEFAPETRWRAEALAEVAESAEFRIARPLRTLDGEWIAGNGASAVRNSSGGHPSPGWEASLLVSGRPDTSRPDDAIRAGIAFHEAIARLPRPDFLDFRTDPWAVGDRMAWGELPPEGSATARDLLRPLFEARRPVESAAQAVHGDLPGNVLFAPGEPPAVIDWAVYWRPPAWAAAVAVADALCWYDADPSLIGRWAQLPEWQQMLIRALIYRIVTHDVAEHWTPAQFAAYQPAVAAVLS